MDLATLNPYLVKAGWGALYGLGAALAVDYLEFRKWKSASDALSYDWGVAAWRWLQGAVGGAVLALGFVGGEA